MLRVVKDDYMCLLGRVSCKAHFIRILTHCKQSLTVGWTFSKASVQSLRVACLL